MRNDTPLAIFWRRRWIVLGVFLSFTITVAVVSKVLNKVYATDSTLLIAASSTGTTPDFDRVQASQALARSYADIIKSPNIAQRVANALNGQMSKAYVLGHTSFQPLAQTQLLKITAEDRNPHRAKLLADTYATVFINYARTNLAPTTKGNISLADSAPFPTEPDRPKPTLYTLVGALVGLLLGLGLAFVRDRFDKRLRTAADVEARFDLPVLGRVPRRGRSDSSIAAFNEAYRILRTNLEFTGRAGNLDWIAVTSAAEGEGKTTTVVQLATASAEVGLDVIVLEADLRRPALQERLMPEREEPLRPGLSNYLVEAAELEEVIYPTRRPNVSRAPSGPLPPSPAGLLESRRARELVSAVLARCDLLLIDCPPLNVAADASIITRWVDGVIMVLDLHSSNENTVRGGMRQLQAVQAPLLGMLLNRDRESEVSSYSYYMPGRDGKGRERKRDKKPALTGSSRE